jgi:hypothetical protein
MPGRCSLPWWSSLSSKRSLPWWWSLSLRWSLSQRWISCRVICCLIIRFSPYYILSFCIFNRILLKLLTDDFLISILLKISKFSIPVQIETILNSIILKFIWPSLKWCLLLETLFSYPIFITWWICIFKS